MTRKSRQGWLPIPEQDVLNHPGAPKPRINLTRFHGGVAPNSTHRVRVTPVTRRASMSWAQRLQRVFGVDIETCPTWGAATVAAGRRDGKEARQWANHRIDRGAGKPLTGEQPG